MNLRLNGMNLRLNETVAGNVTRLREAKGWSRGDLASRLGVGPHVARDYERPRKGAPQRQFLWEEIFNLCAVLEATIFELVLPEVGRDTKPPGMEHLPLVIPQVINDKGSEEMWSHWGRDDRSIVLETLIGPGLEPEHLESLASMKRKREEKLIQELKNLLSEMEEEE